MKELVATVRCAATSPPPPRRRGDACWMLQEALTCRTHDTSARTIAGAFSSLTEFLQLDFPSRNSVISEKKSAFLVHSPLCWTVSMGIAVVGAREGRRGRRRQMIPQMSQ